MRMPRFSDASFAPAATCFANLEKTVLSVDCVTAQSDMLSCYFCPSWNVSKAGVTKKLPAGFPELSNTSICALPQSPDSEVVLGSTVQGCFFPFL